MMLARRYDRNIFEMCVGLLGKRDLAVRLRKASAGFPKKSRGERDRIGGDKLLSSIELARSRTKEKHTNYVRIPVRRGLIPYEYRTEAVFLFNGHTCPLDKKTLFDTLQPSHICGLPASLTIGQAQVTRAKKGVDKSRTYR